ncbi:MAG: outer membrane beta-barrel protein [Panacagrimonas sp.]
MHKTLLIGIAAAAALSLAGAAAAQEKTAYVGANAGMTKWNVDWNRTNEDTSGTGYRVYAGYNFHRWFGAEVFYWDLGKTTASPAELKGSGYGVAGVYNLRFGRDQAARFMARAGLASNKATGNTASRNFAGTKSSVNAAIGVGMGYDVAKNVMLRADLDLTSIEAADGQAGGVQMLSAGVTFRF